MTKAQFIIAWVAGYGVLMGLGAVAPGALVAFWLAAIPALSAYFGTTEVGWTIGDGDPVKLTAESALQMTIWQS